MKDDLRIGGSRIAAGRWVGSALSMQHDLFLDSRAAGVIPHPSSFILIRKRHDGTIDARPKP